jgi:ABC-2 type transport system permease protein
MTLTRLVMRQLRASALTLVAITAVMVGMGVASYHATSPANWVSVNAMLNNPSIVAFYGHFRVINSAGAFVAWKFGQTLAVALAIVSALAATKMLRASEDEGTWDLLVNGRGGRHAPWSRVVASLVSVSVALSLVTALVLGARGASTWAFAAMMGGLSFFGAACGLVCAQLFSPRRYASLAAVVVIAVAFTVRMAGDLESTVSWLSALSPLGWLERLGAFQRLHPVWVVPVALVDVALVMVAQRIAMTRDVGAAVFSRHESHALRRRGLSGPWGFALRERSGVVIGWTVGLSSFAMFFGYLTKSMVSFVQQNPSYHQLLARFGMSDLLTTKGYLAQFGALLGLVTAFLGSQLVVTLANDLAEHRLDIVLATGAGRVRWLLASVRAAFWLSVVVVLVAATSMGVGVAASGAKAPLWWSLAALANGASTVPVFIGLAALVAVMVPRHGAVVMSSGIALINVIAELGTYLHLPQWVLDFSPFHYTHLVPLQSWNVAATVSELAIGVVASLAAAALWRRRDLK